MKPSNLRTNVLGNGLSLRKANTGLTHSLTLKMETENSSETSVNFYRTIWRHVPQDSTLHSHSHENIKFHIRNNWQLIDWVFVEVPLSTCN
jgi:hypothetical protein